MMNVFLDATPCSLVVSYRRFGRTCCLLHGNRRNSFFWNVHKFVRNYTASRPRRRDHIPSDLPSSTVSTCYLYCSYAASVVQFEYCPRSRCHLAVFRPFSSTGLTHIWAQYKNKFRGSVYVWQSPGGVIRLWTGRCDVLRSRLLFRVGNNNFNLTIVWKFFKGEVSSWYVANSRPKHVAI